MKAAEIVAAYPYGILPLPGEVWVNPSLLFLYLILEVKPEWVRVLVLANSGWYLMWELGRVGEIPRTRIANDVRVLGEEGE